jgi:hypothetical protein
MKLPTQFAIFGSHDSEDLDVMYFVDELPTLQECKILAAQLEAQHQSTKEVDVNLCVVKDCHVVTTYKGTVDEVNNMLHYTTNMHVQPSTFPEIKAMDRNIPLKVARVLRGILSFISRTEYRPLIKQALKGDAWEKLNTLQCIRLETINDLGDKNKTMQDFYKLFAFQVGQAMGLMNGDEFYSKKSIAKQYPLLKPYLYREEDSFPGIDYVKDEFIIRVKEVCSMSEIHE